MMHKIPTARSHFEETFSILSQVIDDDQFLDSVDLASSLIAATIEKGKKIISCGNGGSMCDAMHFSQELSGYFNKKRRPLSSICISDPSYITCVSNDTKFDYIYSRLARNKSLCTTFCR